MRRILLAVAVLCVGCSAPESPPLPQGFLVVRNATSQPLIADVDGQGSTAARHPMAAGGVTSAIVVATGTRTLRLVNTSETLLSSTNFTAQSGLVTVLTAAPGAGSALDVSPLPDTGSVPASGMSKLRAVHMASSAPDVDIWRIQPDYPSPVRFMFPFALGASSSFIQSMPGAWTVIATPKLESWPAGSSTDARDHAIAQLTVTTGPGDSKTVVLVDNGSGGVAFLLASK